MQPSSRFICSESSQDIIAAASQYNWALSNRLCWGLSSVKRIHDSKSSWRMQVRGDQ